MQPATSFQPPERPKMGREDAETILLARGLRQPVALLGVRGYYRDSMGERGVNDRGIYDDAAFLLAPGLFLAVNFNTDPMAWRDGIATLVLNPLFPASGLRQGFDRQAGPAHRLFQGLSSKSKFLAAPLKATASERH